MIVGIYNCAHTCTAKWCQTPASRGIPTTFLTGLPLKPRYSMANVLCPIMMVITNLGPPLKTTTFCSRVLWNILLKLLRLFNFIFSNSLSFIFLRWMHLFFQAVWGLEKELLPLEGMFYKNKLWNKNKKKLIFHQSKENLKWFCNI